MIFAIDFDGTCCKEEYPNIGEEIQCIISAIHNIQKSPSAKWILWTMREGKPLQEALDWLKERGCFPDAVNDNLPEIQKKWGDNPRKISADCYIDDRNLAFDVKSKEIYLPGKISKTCKEILIEKH